MRGPQPLPGPREPHAKSGLAGDLSHSRLAHSSQPNRSSIPAPVALNTHYFLHSLPPPFVQLAAWPGYIFLPYVNSILLTLYSHMGRFMLLQLDAYIREFLIRLGQGLEGEPEAAQEAALEALLDFLSQPHFLTGDCGDGLLSALLQRTQERGLRGPSVSLD